MTGRPLTRSFQRALTLDYDDMENKAMVTAKVGHFACRRGDLDRAEHLTTVVRSLLPAYYDEAFFPALADPVNSRRSSRPGEGPPRRSPPS